MSYSFVLENPFVLTPLQVQVVRIGKCPFCHEKTLRDVKMVAVTEWWAKQCGECGRIFIID
jgi:hypothetical protein